MGFNSLNRVNWEVEVGRLRRVGAPVQYSTGPRYVYARTYVHTWPAQYGLAWCRYMLHVYMYMVQVRVLVHAVRASCIFSAS